MHRVLARRSVAFVSCIIFCAVVYHIPSSWGIIHMNSSNLTNCTASITDLSRIMKNLRNAFIYTASTQQRNGNFQQWLPYKALCLGKATPRHCILETMRPPCLGQIQLPPLPGEVSPHCPPSPSRARAGSPYTAPATRDPSRPHLVPQVLGEQDCALGATGSPRAASWEGCSSASLCREAVWDSVNPQGLHRTL